MSKFYKAPDNSIHFVGDEFLNLLPVGCVEITENEAKTLASEFAKNELNKLDKQ